jgi:hypothetical protein
MGFIVREAIETELHPYNINREGGIYIGKLWTPLIRLPNNCREIGPGPFGYTVRILSLTLSLFTVNPLQRGYEISLCSLAI